MKAEDLLSIGKKPPIEVDVEGAGKVFMRQPNGAEFESLFAEWAAGVQKHRLEGRGEDDFRPSRQFMTKAIQMMVSNEKGDRLFENQEQAGELSPKVFQALFVAAITEFMKMGDIEKKD